MEIGPFCKLASRSDRLTRATDLVLQGRMPRIASYVVATGSPPAADMIVCQDKYPALFFASLIPAITSSRI